MKKLLAVFAIALSSALVAPATSLACGGDDEVSDKGEAAPESATHATYSVDKMSCGDCAGKIRTAVKALDGVYTVNVSFKKKRVDVAFDDKATSAAKIRKVIEKLGYTTRVAGNA